MSTIYKLLLEQAGKSIEKAKAGLQRPEEDVVAFSVCSNAGNAVKFLLSALLEENQISYERYSSLPQLIELCKSHIEAFKTFDFKEFDCVAYHNNIDENYCLDVKKVTGCLEVAENLKAFISQLDQKEMIKT